MTRYTYHCLFEQSGTFKNEFKKLGYEAYDYDVLNDFGETDYVIDLYKEIEKAYDKKPSLFDKFGGGKHYLLAFFPCIRFENQIYMHFQGNAVQMAKWSDKKKLEYNIKLHGELHHLYILITKLAIVCIDRDIPLIIENPYSSEHYLTRYWSLKPSLIDDDRTIRGDYFKKPTQYWFINCEPSENIIFEPMISNNTKSIVDTHNIVERSLISKEYANRFIREFILKE